MVQVLRVALRVTSPVADEDAAQPHSPDLVVLKPEHGGPLSGWQAVPVSSARQPLARLSENVQSPDVS